MNILEYNQIVAIPRVKEAMNIVCETKLMEEGYADMSYFIDVVDARETIRHEMKTRDTELDRLLYPKFATIKEAEEILAHLGKDVPYDMELSVNEATVIVYWIYASMDTKEQREKFTGRYFSNDERISYYGKIGYKEGVIYFINKVDVNFIYYIADLEECISFFRTPTTYFRGHADCNYNLVPSVMRNKQLQMFEEDLYYDLIMECPNDFVDCNSHFEKLVKMQHYGLPTRLLDITRNPLVALYFACASEPGKTGEVIILNSNRENVKHHGSDVISVLSSLATMKWKDKRYICKLAQEPESCLKFNGDPVVRKLVQEIRSEKPYFQNKIEPSYMTETYFVKAMKNNDRIERQNGAFLLCGLNKKAQQQRLNEMRGAIGDKKMVVLIKRDTKKYILESLDRLAINYSTLFPEIDCVSKYLTGKYSNVILMLDEYLEKLQE